MKTKTQAEVGTKYRLGLYDPVNPDDTRVRLVGPCYLDTVRDRKKMRRVIAEFYSRARAEGISLCMAAYPQEG